MADLTNEVVPVISAEALQALRGSIAKWEAIVAGSGEDNGTKNCALCAVYYEDDECFGCPVANHTLRDNCDGTPYWDWVSTHEGGRFPFKVTNETQRAAAQAELDFLKSLELKSPWRWPMTDLPSNLEMQREIDLLRAALKVAQQAILEFRHAQDCGPGWYTRGEAGMYQQVQMWLRRGIEAVRDALGAYDDNGQYLKEIPAVETTRDAHIANEWADMASNGVQWLRNVRDGISSAAEGLAEMEQNLLRIRALQSAVKTSREPGYMGDINGPGCDPDVP